MQKLQNDNGCKSLHLTIFTFLVARGFGPYSRVSEFRVSEFPLTRDRLKGV